MFILHVMFCTFSKVNYGVHCVEKKKVQAKYCVGNIYIGGQVSGL